MLSQFSLLSDFRPLLSSKKLLSCHSIQFSRSVVSDSLRPHEPQHARPPCPSPPPGVCSNSCPLSQRCHPTISSSVMLLSSSFQSFPASGSFPMRWWPKYWCFSSSISPSSEHSGFISFRTDWFDLRAVHGTRKSFSNTTIQKHQFFSTQRSLWSNSHSHT